MRFRRRKSDAIRIAFGPFLRLRLPRQALFRASNVLPVCCARPTCRPGDPARRLLRLNAHLEGARSNRRDAVASALLEARKRRAWNGRVPAPLES
jgi:hypothetical protein